MSELDLRRWLVKAWGRRAGEAPLMWCEPTRGSSMGAPDVYVVLTSPKFGAVLVPLELKVWRVGRTGEASRRLRPAQHRYHALMARAGIPTLVLAALEEGHDTAYFELWQGRRLVAGEEVPDIRKPFSLVQGRSALENALSKAAFGSARKA